MDWFRWHHGTATDPKWRVIARKSGQPIHAVLSVWAMVLESASQSSDRGALSGWDNEDTAAAPGEGRQRVAAPAASSGLSLQHGGARRRRVRPAL